MKIFHALIAATTLTIGSPVQAQRAAPKIIEDFASFLGTWEPVEPAPANSPRAQYFAERYAPGPNNAILWFTQGPHRTDGAKDAVPGFLYWHPGSGRYQYTAFNTMAGLYFEGYIGDVHPGRYELFYTVHYPEGAQGIPQGAGAASRQFRDTHALLDADTIRLETFVLMPDGEWKPFSPTGAASRLRRVTTAASP